MTLDALHRPKRRNIYVISFRKKREKKGSLVVRLTDRQLSAWEMFKVIFFICICRIFTLVSFSWPYARLFFLKSHF